MFLKDKHERPKGMRKVIWRSIAIASLLLAPLARAEGIPKDWTEYDISQIAPTKVSEEQFYKYEEAIVRGSSGSGGFFLGEDEIEWLKKVSASLEVKGIKLKDEYRRGFVFADSYFHLKNYNKAIKEYRNCGANGSAEEAEWYLSNEGIENGPLKIVEYPGQISFEASEAAKVEDDKFLFVSYFKGPIYRYDKINDKHAVIYAPPTRYDWSESIKWNGKILLIALNAMNGDGDQFEFDNSTNRLQKKVPGTAGTGC